MRRCGNAMLTLSEMNAALAHAGADKGTGNHSWSCQRESRRVARVISDAILFQLPFGARFDTCER